MGLRNFIQRIIGLHKRQPIACTINKAILETHARFDDILIQTRIEYLRDKTLNSTSKGISLENHSKEQIIVSLTTFGERIHNAYLPIESIMQGSMKPDKIILWLAKDEFEGKPLPITLQNQQKRGLEIAYCHDLKQYNKLIHTLKEYPKASIITIDDDVIYEYDLLERLYNRHLDRKNVICACRMHRILTDEKHTPLPYMQWNLCIDNEGESILNFPTGVGGILYPPQCFTDEVFNSSVFMQICPKADDIWFYAMSRIAGTPAVLVKTGHPEGHYLPLPITDDALSLHNTSSVENGNDIQFKNVISHYNINLTE